MLQVWLSSGFPLLFTILVLVLGCWFWRRREERPLQQVTPAKEAVRQKLSIHGDKIVQAESMDILTRLTVNYDIYLIFQVSDDSAEQQIKTLLTNSPIPSHHVLFCETKRGLQACIRQLNARFHIESELDLAVALKSVLNQIVMLTNEQCEGFYQVLRLDETEEFLAKLMTSERL
jgi:hypothetical protein